MIIIVIIFIWSFCRGLWQLCITLCKKSVIFQTDCSVLFCSGPPGSVKHIEMPETTELSEPPHRGAETRKLLY